MIFLTLIWNNLFTIPIFCFVLGCLLSTFRIQLFFNAKMHHFLTSILLFSIGLKGGIALVQHASHQIFFLLGVLVIWGLIQPVCSYLLLRRLTLLDQTTAIAVAASFGSISVMTFIAGAAFLEKLSVHYEQMVVAAVAVMEVPAIISGLAISKKINNSVQFSLKKIMKESFFNKTVLFIFCGIFFGGICSILRWNQIPDTILVGFKPSLFLFLFNMGILVGYHRHDLRRFSWSLSFFGLYMPLIGAIFGILLSYGMGLDVGTGTLITILSASASYIAVPAAMKIALPEAKEAIYLPLALGITFPFNVVIGIPLYYQMAVLLLG